MSVKRLLPVLLLAVIAALAVVSSAPADDFADAPCFDVAGPDTATCPTGTAGTPYSLALQLAEGSGCGPGLTTWTVSSGALPPGLALASDSGQISGTPTGAGNFTFYVTVTYPVLDRDPPGPSEGDCVGGFSDKKHMIPINPGIPKLTIGPESAAAGTVGVAYSLPMTASVADPKTWSISAGALPPGLSIGASDGMISGTPTTTGTFVFTVLAVISPSRSDTKTLSIVVRQPLAIAAPVNFEAGVARTEVGVRFASALVATGGLGPYTSTLTGTLPDGVEFDEISGSLSGRPELAGTYRFGLSVVDAEGRTATYAGRITVASRLAITTKRLQKGRVGRLYRAKLKFTGGVASLNAGDVSSLAWRIKRGPLPRGIRFNRITGSFVGIPVRSGTWTVTVEIVDALRVKAAAALVIVVAPLKPKR